jgi:hypothetical protein
VLDRTEDAGGKHVHLHLHFYTNVDFEKMRQPVGDGGGATARAEPGIMDDEEVLATCVSILLTGSSRRRLGMRFDEHRLLLRS